MFDKLFTNTSYLQKGLDAAALRHQVINNNIANAETPGFKSSSVEFESMFKKALKSGGSFETKTTRKKHEAFSPSADQIEPVVIENSITSMRADENNVDIDYQNAQLAENQLYYNALVEKLNGEYTRLRMAIREGN